MNYEVTSFGGHAATVVHDATSLWIPSQAMQVSGKVTEAGIIEALPVRRFKSNTYKYVTCYNIMLYVKYFKLLYKKNHTELFKFRTFKLNWLYLGCYIFFNWLKKFIYIVLHVHSLPTSQYDNMQYLFIRLTSHIRFSHPNVIFRK